MFLRSIRWRLQLWLAFLLVSVLSGFGVTIYQLQRVNQLKQIDEELERRVAVLSGALRGPPPKPGFAPPPFEGSPGHRDFDKDTQHLPPPRIYPGSHPEPPPFRGERKGPFGPRDFPISEEISSLFDQTSTGAFYFTVWSRDGAMFKRSSNAPADVTLPRRVNNTDTRTYARTRNGYREAFHFTELADCVLAGRSISIHLDAMRRFKLWLLAAGGTVLAFGLGGGWWLTSRAMRPVDDISIAASRISEGNLSERINVADTDSELGRLASVLNTTFSRLETAFAQQTQFTADASHELRTPLAVIISEAQTTLARERGAAEYRESITVCLDAAQQMRRLAESLLQLARFDAGQEPSHRIAVDLAENTRLCVGRIGPLVKERGINIHCDLAPAETWGDADRLGQLITNVLTNAIHYNKPKGEILVSTRSENGDAVLTVTDTGQGIAAEDLPHVFERFYRADKSRSRAEDRSGLGLAICKAIVDRHGGTIEASSELGSGTTFTVRLPALHAS
jgi:two-component system OmpR family sensor kinase